MGDSLVSGEFRNGKNTPTPPVFSEEWHAKDLRDTELGRVYGEWEGGIGTGGGARTEKRIWLEGCTPCFL